jgi:hypothetical protein
MKFSDHSPQPAGCPALPAGLLFERKRMNFTFETPSLKRLEAVLPSGGQIERFRLHNRSSRDLFVRFYNAACKPRGPGIVPGQTKADLVLKVPANGSVHFGMPSHSEPSQRPGRHRCESEQDVRIGDVPFFDKGIMIACTTGAADDNTGAPGPNELEAAVYGKYPDPETGFYH